MAIFDGIRVIDFGTGLAPSLATMLLADNGADVIKVEPPGGDPLRATPAWRMWNRGKRSVVLDIRSDEGRDAAVELMGSADVVLQNWQRRGGRGQRRGLRDGGRNVAAAGLCDADGHGTCGSVCLAAL